MTGIDLFNKEVIKTGLRYDSGFVPIMKITGFLLLLAGWLLVLSALGLLPSGIARNGFILGGLGVEAIGMVLVVRSHKSGGES